MVIIVIFVILILALAGVMKLGMVLSRYKIWRLAISVIFGVIVIGTMVSYAFYKNPPSLPPQTYDAKSHLPIPISGRPLGGPVIRGLCMTWFFPFIGEEMFKELVVPPNYKKCVAFYTGTGGWDFIRPLTGWLGTLCLFMLFITAVISKRRSPPTFGVNVARSTEENSPPRRFF